VNSMTPEQRRSLLAWINSHLDEIRTQPYRITAERASKELGFFVHSLMMSRLARPVLRRLLTYRGQEQSP